MKNSSFPDSTPKEDSIAVVGLGCLFPGSHDRHGVWAGMRAGSDHVDQVPEGYWTPEDYHDPDKSSPDRTYGNRGAFLSPIPFHPLEYGITPRDLEATDEIFSFPLFTRILKELLAGFAFRIAHFTSLHVSRATS